ncbi:MAG: HNH endonuclease [Stenotrophobium sp.]
MSNISDKFGIVREALNDLEKSLNKDSEPSTLRNVDALELPELVSAIVDYLQPALSPYEAAIYWLLFRRSILSSGQQYVRVSVRSFQSGFIQSFRSGQTLAYATIQDALGGLEKKGALSKAGETNREGTLYKISLPEEIELCRERMRAEATVATPGTNVAIELDYYNVAENRLKVFERDGYECHYCKKQLTRFTATLDHIQPVSKGGDNSLHNLTTACLHCNSRRGNRPVMKAIIGASQQ